MRFLADENFPAAAVRALRDAGHDIVSVLTDAARASDREVLAWTAREGRILLMFDKDFGELARAAALPFACGVLLFRIQLTGPSDIGRRLADLIIARDDWAGQFSVIERNRLRMRPLA